MTLSYFETKKGLKIAYIHTPARKKGEHLPAVMFLSGFKSDMEGTKAQYLEQKCIARGQEFVRFDYSGHGKSDGAFVEGTIGSWKQDTADVLNSIVTRDVILVGSSMGGWLALRLLLECPEKIKAVVGIAAAPDFTKDIEAKMNDDDRAMIKKIGRLEVPNDYSEEPYIFTRALLEDGMQQCVLGKIHETKVPIILVQGKQDADVEWGKALQIKESFTGSEIDIIFIDDGDHSLSRESDLQIINEAVEKLSGI